MIAALLNYWSWCCVSVWSPFKPASDFVVGFMRDRLWFWSAAVPGKTKLEVRWRKNVKITKANNSQMSFLTIEHWSLLFSCLDVVLDVIIWVHLLVCHRDELEFSQSVQD